MVALVISFCVNAFFITLDLIRGNASRPRAKWSLLTTNRQSELFCTFYDLILGGLIMVTSPICRTEVSYKSNTRESDLGVFWDQLLSL